VVRGRCYVAAGGIIVMQRIATALISVVLLAAGSATLSSCREEGPAERAGRAIDEATEDVTSGAKEMMDEASDQVDEAVETAKQKMDEATKSD